MKGLDPSEEVMLTSALVPFQAGDGVEYLTPSQAAAAVRLVERGCLVSRVVHCDGVGDVTVYDVTPMGRTALACHKAAKNVPL